MTNPTPEPGDRIRVTFEGTYRSQHDADGLDLSGDEGAYGWLPLPLEVATAVEILPPPEPPVDTVIIGYDRETTEAGSDQWVFERMDDEVRGWLTTGADVRYSYEQVIERTKYNRQIIEP